MEINIKIERSTAEEMREHGTKSEAMRYDRMVMRRVAKKKKKRFPQYEPYIQVSSVTSVLVEPDEKWVQQEVYAIIREAYVDVFKGNRWRDDYAKRSNTIYGPLGMPVTP